MQSSLPNEYGHVPSLGVPGCLQGDDLKAFSARGGVNYIPCATGSNIGPNSSMLFQIPQMPLSYIKPNSVMLRGRCTVTMSALVGGNAIAFAGQNSATAFTTASTNTGVGGASSLFSRFTLRLPGGLELSYAQANHYRNSISAPHGMAQEFVVSELRQLEHAGAVRVATAANPVIWFSVLVDIPALTCAQALPLLLMNSGIQLEVVTDSIANAFASIGGTVTNFSLDNLGLYFETITVTQEYKQALIHSKQGRPYSMTLNDRMGLVIGVAAATTNRFQIGLGLQSMKGVVWAFQAPSTVTAGQMRYYSSNGTQGYNIYVNGQIVSATAVTSDDLAYAELKRALGHIGDTSNASSLISLVSADASGARNNFTSAQCAFGATTSYVDDDTISFIGTPCDTLAMELIIGTPDALAWQNTTPGAAQNCYVFVFYDSVLTIDANGSCSIHK